MANVAVTRDDVGALIPEEVSYDILSAIQQESFVLSNFRVKRVGRKVQRMPALNAVPSAYWVNGDAGLKQTTTMKWANKYIYIEELAVIVIIDENSADDIDEGFDFWGEAKPLIVNAFNRKIDETVIFGYDYPNNANWPTAIVPTAIAKNMYIEKGTATQANGGIATDISELMAKIEAVGYNATIAAATIDFKKNLRNARDTTGQKLQDVTTETVHGLTMNYIGEGMWEEDTVNDPVMIIGQRDELIVGLRSDISYKILTESVITDSSGNILVNLAQQDSIALRVTMRMGWQMANRFTYKEADADLRYPFAVLVDQQ